MERVEEKKKLLFRSTEDTDVTDNGVGQTESGHDSNKSLDDPPVDWYEPLEEDWEDDDDAQSWDFDGVRDAESLAGESERSSSVAGSEKNYRGRGGGGAIGRRKRKKWFGLEDGWEDCLDLGEGWKRKVVLRRSGLSVGQSDVYYISPKGDRVRSKIELLKYIGNTVDLTNFDFKTGIFHEGKPPRKGIKKRKMDPSSPADCGFSSESSLHTEPAESGSTHSPGPANHLNHFAQQRLSPSLCQMGVSRCPSTSNENSDQALIIQPTASAKQTMTLKVPAKQLDRLTNNQSNSYIGICSRCRNSFTSIKKQIMCEKCSKACHASKDTRKITFRKWLPCGFCRACQLTDDCGVCASCRKGKLNPQHRRPVRCRKRKCLCPSVKRPERLETINMDAKNSDSDDQSSCYEENNSEEFLRKHTRSCGQCKGCLAKADCGACDYCIDKPKFGGSNKKRQKCRQRQCQRGTKGWTAPERPGQHFDYSLKVTPNNSNWDLDLSDSECAKITQVFSLGGDNTAAEDLDPELLELLSSLRDTPLPMLWCAVLAEGPHLQLLQCSKLSAMADTTVQIEPGFRYHISVQGQPLLPTHRLYHAHPARLTSVAQVATLLEDLERYSVCQGFKSEPLFGSEPFVQVRASTCDFLVVPEKQCCARCKSAEEKQ